jgi:glutaminase
MTVLQPLIDAIVSDMRVMADKGKVADYIPPLARISPEKFGLAVVTAEGKS